MYCTSNAGLFAFNADANHADGLNKTKISLTVDGV
jgi:hypothetical protein